MRKDKFRKWWLENQGNALLYLTHAYDGEGRQISTINALGQKSEIIYDLNGNIVKRIDSLGNESSYIYNSENRVVEVIDALGNSSKTEYDLKGNVVKLIDAKGSEILFKYDKNDRLIEIIDENGKSKKQEYDALGNIIKTIDAKGNETSFVYDSKNQLIETKDALGNISKTDYDVLGRTLSTTNAKGAVSLFEYDSNGNLIKTTDALGNITTFNYDKMNRLIAEKDAKGNVSGYEYDSNGNLVKETNAQGYSKLFEYNSNSLLIKETNELGHSKTYTHDALGRVLSLRNEKDEVENFSYDALSRIKTVTNAQGGTITYNYDSLGNLVETIDELGASIYFEYDALGNMLKSSQGQNVTLYSYDKKGLATKEVSADSSETLFVYDANGNLSQKTDAKGSVTNYSYNALDLIENIDYADGKTASFAYDANENLVSFDDWTGQTSYEIDLLDQITKLNNPDGKTVSFEYDEVGNQKAITYPNGNKVDYGFDELNRMISVNDKSAITEYSYDALGRVIEKKYPNGASPDLTKFEINTDDFAPDPLAELEKEINEAITEAIKEETSQIPDNEQESSSLEQESSGLNEMTFNSEDSPQNEVQTEESTELDIPNLEDLNPSKDLEEELRSADIESQSSEDILVNKLEAFDIKGLNKPSLNAVYDYDLKGRIIKEEDYRGSKTYVYDSFDNLVEEDLNGLKSIYEYNNRNQLISKTSDKLVKTDEGNSIQNVLYESSYDLNGNLLEEKLEGEVYKTFEYNSQNKLAKGSTEKGISEYLYNALGQRVSNSKTIDGKTFKQSFIVDPSKKNSENIYNDLIAYSDGIYETNYVYGADGRISQESESFSAESPIEKDGKVYYHLDRLGSALAYTDETGATIGTVFTDIWGDVVGKTKELEKHGIYERFTTYTYDEVFDIHFAVNRFLDSKDKRFTQEDPFKDGVNWYSYVRGNPLKFVDPLGLDAYIIYQSDDKNSTKNAQAMKDAREKSGETVHMLPFADESEFVQSWNNMDSTHDDTVIIHGHGNNTGFGGDDGFNALSYEYFGDEYLDSKDIGYFYLITCYSGTGDMYGLGTKAGSVMDVFMQNNDIKYGIASDGTVGLTPVSFVPMMHHPASIDYLTRDGILFYTQEEDGTITKEKTNKAIYPASSNPQKHNYNKEEHEQRKEKSQQRINELMDKH